LMWPILGQYVWPNFFIGDSWDEEIEHLKEWTVARMTWMDENIETMSQTMSNIATNKQIPVEYTLEQNYPNPFNPSTTINYSATTDSHISLKVYNSLGQQVKTLVDDFQSAGHHAVVWTGDDDSGYAVPTGLYTYRLKSDAQVLTRKMLLIQ